MATYSENSSLNDWVVPKDQSSSTTEPETLRYQPIGGTLLPVFKASRGEQNTIIPVKKEQK